MGVDDDLGQENCPTPRPGSTSERPMSTSPCVLDHQSPEEFRKLSVKLKEAFFKWQKELEGKTGRANTGKGKRKIPEEENKETLQQESKRIKSMNGNGRTVRDVDNTSLTSSSSGEGENLQDKENDGDGEPKLKIRKDLFEDDKKDPSDPLTRQVLEEMAREGSDISRKVIQGLEEASKTLNDQTASVETRFAKLKEFRSMLVESLHIVDGIELKTRDTDLGPLKLDLDDNLASCEVLPVEEVSNYFLKLIAVELLLQEPASESMNQSLFAIHYRLTRLLHFYAISKKTPLAVEGTFSTILVAIRSQLSPDVLQKYNLSVPTEWIIRLWDHVRNFHRRAYVNDDVKELVLLDQFKLGYEGFCKLIFNITLQLRKAVYRTRNSSPPDIELDRRHCFETDMLFLSEISGRRFEPSTTTPVNAYLPPTFPSQRQQAQVVRNEVRRRVSTDSRPPVIVHTGQTPRLQFSQSQSQLTHAQPIVSNHSGQIPSLQFGHPAPAIVSSGHGQTPPFQYSQYTHPQPIVHNRQPSPLQLQLNAPPIFYNGQRQTQGPAFQNFQYGTHNGQRQTPGSGFQYSIQNGQRQTQGLGFQYSIQNGQRQTQGLDFQYSIQNGQRQTQTQDPGFQYSTQNAQRGTSAFEFSSYLSAHNSQTPAVQVSSHNGQTPAVQVSSHNGQTPAVQASAHSGQTPVVQVSSHNGQTPAVQASAHSGQTPVVQVISHNGQTPAVQVISHNGQTPAVQVSSHNGQTPAVQVSAHSGQTPAVQVSSHNGQIPLVFGHPAPPVSQQMNAFNTRNDIH